jgi:hypothetical protein
MGELINTMAVIFATSSEVTDLMSGIDLMYEKAKQPTLLTCLLIVKWLSSVMPRILIISDSGIATSATLTDMTFV